jgi:hypothetical protein
MAKSMSAATVANAPMRSVSPSKAMSVGNCKYRKVLINDLQITDRGRNEIFSPLTVRDRLLSSRKIHLQN